MAQNTNPNEWTERHDGMDMTIRITTDKCDCCKFRGKAEFIYKPTGAVICRSCFGS